MARRHEDDDAEYRHDEADMRAAGLIPLRDPRGGTTWVRRWNSDAPEPDDWDDEDAEEDQ